GRRARRAPAHAAGGLAPVRHPGARLRPSRPHHLAASRARRGVFPQGQPVRGGGPARDRRQIQGQRFLRGLERRVAPARAACTARDPEGRREGAEHQLKRRAALLAACSVALASFAQSPPPDTFTRPEKGNCIACHQLPEGAGRAGGGDVGPALAGARMRELGAMRLRGLLEDPMQANPATAMPPYGKHRILESAEIARLVQYLQALPDGAPAASPPAADSAATAAAAMPALLERGRAIWQRKFKDKRSLASCFPNGGRRIAASYPQYDPRLKRVITLETAINQCLKAHKEELFDPADPETMALAVAYVRSLADGQKIAVRVPAAAEPKLEEGRRLYFTRMGQRNFACASCHVRAAG